MSIMDVRPPEPLPGARLLFSIDPGVAFLNHGSFGAVPVPVQRAQQRLRDEMEGNPMRFFTRGLPERLAHARRHIATFLGADPGGTALVDNTTTGVSLVLDSLGPGPGDEIVTTDHGYGSVDLAVARLVRTAGVVHRVARIPLDATDTEIVAAVRARVTPRTRLVIVDQITSSTARLFPVREIAAAVRPSGAALLVDAAHVPGHIDGRVAELGADFWVGNLHKWGYAPRASAVLVVAARWRDAIRPRVVSWSDPDGFPTAVEEQGTRDRTAWLAAPAGLFTLRTLGVETVRAHNAALAAYGQHVIAATLGVLVADPPGCAALAMRVIPLPDGVAATWTEAARLRTRIADELATEVAVNPWQGRGLLRISAQVYNRPAEYESLAERLPTLLK